MSELFSRTFWVDAAERSVKTFAYSTVGVLGPAAALQESHSVPWVAALVVGATSAALSVLGSLASLKVGNSGTASLTKVVEPADNANT